MSAFQVILATILLLLDAPEMSRAQCLLLEDLPKDPIFSDYWLHGKGLTLNSTADVLQERTVGNFIY